MRLGRWDSLDAGSGKAGPEPMDARSFFIVLLIGALGAAIAFVLTVAGEPASQEAPQRIALVSSGPDPTPGWGGRLARPLYSMGRYDELATSSAQRIVSWGRDPEAWLFGALAHEALAEQPGLSSIEHKSESQRLWEGLLEFATELDRNGDGENEQGALSIRMAYFEGWALKGLGRPLMARERFGVYLDWIRDRGGMGPYNTACYETLAGNHGTGVRLWSDSIGRARDPLWSVADPDFEAIRDELWDTELAFRVFSIFNADRGSHQRNGEQMRAPSFDRSSF